VSNDVKDTETLETPQGPRSGQVHEAIRRAKAGIGDLKDLILFKDRATSVDLMAITVGNRVEKIRFDMDGIMVTVEIHGEYDVTDRLERRNAVDAYLVGRLSRSTPLEGPTAAVFVEKAREAFSLGPMPLTTTEQAAAWDKVLTVYSRAEAALHSADSLMLTTRTLDEAVDVAYRLGSRWLPAPGTRIARLGDIDGRLALLSRQIMSETNPAPKFRLLSEFIDVLKTNHGITIGSTKRTIVDKTGPFSVVMHPFRALKDGLSGNAASYLAPCLRIVDMMLLPNKGTLAGLLFLDMTVAALTLPVPFIIAAGYKGGFDLSNVLMVAGILGVVYVLAMIMNWLSDVYETSAMEHIWLAWEMRIIRRLLGRSDLGKFPAGEISYRVETDARASFDIIFELTRTFFGGIARIAMIPLVLMFLPGYIILHAVIMSAAIGCVYALASVSIYNRSKGIIRLRGQLSARMTEVLTHMETIRVERLGGDALRRLYDKALPLRDQIVMLNVVIGAMGQAVSFFGTIAPVLLLIEGIMAVKSGEISAGMIFGAGIWAGLIMEPIKSLFAAGPELQRLLIHGRRFLEVYETAEPMETAVHGSTAWPDYPKFLRVEGVGHRFSPIGQLLFSGLTLKFPFKGLSILAGASGSGKSTLLGILNGTTPPSLGSVFVDKVPTSEVAREMWAEKVAIVPQDVFLVEGTVLENMSLGSMKPIAADAAISVLRQVGLWEMLDARGGLRFRLDENAQLSGGEKKRLALARALARKPEILLIDEVAESLDPRLEEEIVGILKDYAITDKAAVIMVAHRPSITAEGDIVVNLPDGIVTKNTTRNGNGNVAVDAK
jgi:ABC-type bacteriocin/lantibiotic exporter with double-glycine peptidase domain